ncbi:hypothetical protein E2C01_008277 [Portunus trituberculatus]|uniref:Uncharacterized protein n=1 Tax=Portunus trituberculatus TaxID=210409 RepID=A0A5B7D2D4_PORTR|nr:hypothetical protein [Portunus trituberculatus]
MCLFGSGAVWLCGLGEGEEPQACVRLLPNGDQLQRGRRKQAQVSIHHKLQNLMTVLRQQSRRVKDAVTSQFQVKSVTLPANCPRQDEPARTLSHEIYT